MRKTSDTYRYRNLRKARATVAQGTEMDPGRRQLKKVVEAAQRRTRRRRKASTTAAAENVYINPKSNIRYRLDCRVEDGRTSVESLARLSHPRVSKEMEVRWDEMSELGFEKPVPADVRGAAYFRNQAMGVINIPASPASFDQLVTSQSFVSKCLAEEFGSMKMRFVTDLLGVAPYQEFIPDTAETLKCFGHAVDRISSASDDKVAFADGFIELVVCRFREGAERDRKNTFIGDALASQSFTRSEWHRRRNTVGWADDSWLRALPDANDIFYKGEKLWVVQHIHYNIGMLDADGRMVNFLKLGAALDLPSPRFGILAEVLGGVCEDQSRLSIGENARRTIQYAIKTDLADWEPEERLGQLSWRAAAPNGGCYSFVIDNRKVKRPLAALDALLERRRSLLHATGLQHNHPLSAMDAQSVVAFYADVARRLNYSGHATGIRSLGDVRHYDFQG